MKADLSNNFELKKAETYFNKLKEGRAKIELTKKKEKRTVRQNAYLHVCISLFAIEYGYTLEEAKTLLKRECNFMTYEKNGSKFLKRTRDLDTEKLTHFIEWIRTYSSKNGYYIPTSEEYITNSFEIDRMIEAQKNYL